MGSLKSIVFVFVVLIIFSCDDLFISPAKSNLNMEDFEAAWERVQSVYPYLDYKQINWDSIYFVYEPKAEQAKEDEIYLVLVEMLAELKDRHIHVKTEGGEYIPTFSPRRWLKDKYAYSPLVVRNYFDKELKVTGEGKIEFEILPENIGYIYLATFDDDYIQNNFHEALEYVKNTKALIVDIRHNNGGSYQNLVTVVSRFITSPLKKPDFYVLGELVPLEPFVPEGDFQYTNPVVVLINGVCYSTGDIFPEVMKQIPSVTVVGDTTSGGSSGSTVSAPAEFELPSGKRIYVGTTDWRGYNGLPLEWIGCAPDIRIEQTESDINAGKDKQLEYAIRFLK